VSILEDAGHQILVGYFLLGILGAHIEVLLEGMMELAPQEETARALLKAEMVVGRFLETVHLSLVPVGRMKYKLLNNCHQDFELFELHTSMGWFGGSSGMGLSGSGDGGTTSVGIWSSCSCSRSLSSLTERKSGNGRSVS
jgi:hypothetical protein